MYVIIKQIVERGTKMAQRTIHYLFGELISREVELHDKKRFLLGSILPDAYVDLEQRDATHFRVVDETGIYFDFPSFFEKYKKQIQEDDLYLGYYMHLVEDAFYRIFFYNVHQKRPSTKENVKSLHRDYHILNQYVIQKYELENELYEIDKLSALFIDEIGEFRVEEFLKELAEDFVEKILGETVYLTEDMIDEYVMRYMPLALQEVRCAKMGISCLKISDYTWQK